MTQEQFQDAQKIIERIKKCEREIKLLPPTEGSMRTFRSFLKWIKFRIQCWKEDEWCDYLVFVLTDEDIKLLVEARKERIRLYRSQLQSCGINIEEEIDK